MDYVTHRHATQLAGCTRPAIEAAAKRGDLTTERRQFGTQQRLCVALDDKFEAFRRRLGQRIDARDRVTIAVHAEAHAALYRESYRTGESMGAVASRLILAGLRAPAADSGAALVTTHERVGTMRVTTHELA